MPLDVSCSLTGHLELGRTLHRQWKPQTVNQQKPMDTKSGVQKANGSFPPTPGLQLLDSFLFFFLALIF